MKKILENPYISFVARIVVGIIFLLAAVSKVSNPELFAQEIGHYNIMPYWTLNIFALILPWIELITALFLLFGIRLRASAVLTGAMLFMFIVAVSIAMMQGLNIECGCHTQITAHTVGFRKIIENTIFLILTVYIYFFPITKFTLENFVINESKEFSHA